MVLEQVPDSKEAKQIRLFTLSVLLTTAYEFTLVRQAEPSEPEIGYKFLRRVVVPA